MKSYTEAIDGMTKPKERSWFSVFAGSVRDGGVSSGRRASHNPPLCLQGVLATIADRSSQCTNMYLA
jgi:hypothetical protein